MQGFELEANIEVQGFELEIGNVVVPDTPFGLGFQLGLPCVQANQPSSLALPRLQHSPPEAEQRDALAKASR